MTTVVMTRVATTRMVDGGEYDDDEDGHGGHDDDDGGHGQDDDDEDVSATFTTT